MKQTSARLHVLLASRSADAVVIRRGPSKSVCFVHWNRQTDRFKVAQWMRGRVYERRSDLSPDGKFLIYFASNYGRNLQAWTAISRAPYMKAIALFAKGDAWHGGGLFTGDNTYWLNDGYGHTVLRQSSLVKRDEVFHPAMRLVFSGQCNILMDILG